jgi:DNA-binding CsgD family transcriptional regulator
LLEREHELDIVQDALDRLADGPGSTLLIEGPAGIGKTRLLAAATELGRQREVVVLAARGGQLEREMPFGVARQLLEPIVEGAGEAERSRLLAGSAALSLIAFGRGDSDGSNAEVDRFAPIHGLYWLLANLCDSQPVLIVIDDAHWADTQSLGWLDFLARRVADTPVLILAAARTGEADEPVELEPLRLDATELLRPSPLSGPAVNELIAAEFGSSASDDFTEACSKATGGNPFLLTEVLRTLQRTSIGPDTEAARQLASLGTESVARSVRARLQPFGAEAVSLARAIAVLGGAPQLRHASAMAGVSEERAQDLCDRLRDAEILAPGHPIDFVHPLIRTTVYRELSEESRSEAHRQAAELLSATGSGAREVALHLMACAPNGDQWVAGQLREAARTAMRAGAPDAARRYLERALEEPAEEQVELTYELGRALWQASPLEAPEVLVSVAERATDPELHLQALQDAAWTYFDSGNLERAVHWLGRLVTSIPTQSEDARLRAEASLFSVRTLDRGPSPEHSAHIESVVANTASTTPGGLMVRQALSFDRFARCDPVDEVVALASCFPPPPWTGREAAGLEGQRFALVIGPVPSIACKILAWSGQWDVAREAAARGWEGGQSSGLVHVASYREAQLAEIDCSAGRLADSEAEARTAWDIIRDVAPVSIPALTAVCDLLITLIARGHLDEAGELAKPWDLSAPFSVVPLAPPLLHVRGTLRLARGELESGAEDLTTAGDDLEEMDMRNPAAIPWRQEVVPALGALDRTDEARRIVSEGERQARAFGAPHVIGAMLRARSSIEPKRRAIQTLRESVTALSENGAPHELARSQLELGAALRRDGQRSESREPLRNALELAHVSGADGLVLRARDELAAAGSRPRSIFRTGVDSLTASELRTAKLAAEGLGNVEIAQRLFVTRKTVEKHLGNAYTKLEIPSRNELPAALAEPSSVSQ